MGNRHYSSRKAKEEFRMGSLKRRLENIYANMVAEHPGLTAAMEALEDEIDGDWSCYADIHMVPSADRPANQLFLRLGLGMREGTSREVSIQIQVMSEPARHEPGNPNTLEEKAVTEFLRQFGWQIEGRITYFTTRRRSKGSEEKCLELTKTLGGMVAVLTILP